MASGSSYCDDLLILYYATIGSIYVPSSLKASNRSICIGLMFELHGNFDKVPNTSSEGTNPVSPIVSLIAL